MIKKIAMQDILAIQDGIKIIPVNTVGVMGKGLALQFKQKYPNIFEAYRKECYQGKLHVGNITIHEDYVMFPTKDHWKNDSTKEIIKASLEALKELLFIIEVKLNKHPDVYIPRIGCGCGRLAQEIVEMLIEEVLGNVYNNIYLIGF